jgi:sorbitol/mannitol transport system permease protein
LSRRAPLLPALVITLVLTQIPFALTIWYSLQGWNLLNPGQKGFAGLYNFRATFGDNTFWKAIKKHGGPHRRRHDRRRGHHHTVTPFFVVPVAVTLFWRSAPFDPSFGRLGWLSERLMLSIIMITSWRWTPFEMLVLLVGLQALPDDQLDAARVDGANWWRQFRNVVLPHLRPFLELTALLLSMNIIQTFGGIALLTAGGPGFGTANIA